MLRAANLGFPRGGANPKGGGGNLLFDHFFSRKQDENEENWRGARPNFNMCMCISPISVDSCVAASIDAKGIHWFQLHH